MERSLIYNGTITAEQFLFYEIRIASKYYLDGTSVEDAIEEIKKNNLFQYPTERLVARMVRSCYKRLGRTYFGMCHAGLGEYVVPIFDGDVLLGSINAGFFQSNEGKTTRLPRLGTAFRRRYRSCHRVEG